MNSEIYMEINTFANRTSGSIHLLNEDFLIINGPDRVQQVSSTGFEMIHYLYEKKPGAEKRVEKIHKKYCTHKNIIVKISRKLWNH